VAIRNETVFAASPDWAGDPSAYSTYE